ncbi:MAG TPA: hypothetical protein VE242_14085, partial [Chthoniobacterales bacterium]|nr:hypothetical protein [Chthoniobacterales bacterium]
GFFPEEVKAPSGVEVFYHPQAMLPRIVVMPAASRNGVPMRLSIRTESLVDFIAAHDVRTEIRDRFGSRLRRATISVENGLELLAVERLGWRHFVSSEPLPGFASSILAAQEIWRTRKRNFPDDPEGVKLAFDLQAQAIDLVGQDIACELFFTEERRYWERRNRAGQIQRRRQDLFGLGWGNHDHHTFRCSRRFLADLVRFLLNFGFTKRERYYAGAEAGWGAQILEHYATGITVFADVDLMPEETEIDFSQQPLPEARRLGTVGLWCGLHGDSFLQAGMHHLEARFQFGALRDQLAREGVATMKPFSNFEFLKQAFTEGERWPVDPKRVQRLLDRGLITAKQAETFRRDGAVGSHLENLQRKGGYKGFNQKSVSVIIEATDPRALASANHS